jgi:hypothetical protein
MMILLSMYSILYNYFNITPFETLQKIWPNVCLLKKQVYICIASEKKFYSNYPTDYPPIIFYHPQKNAQASNSLLKSCIVNY